MGAFQWLADFMQQHFLIWNDDIYLIVNQIKITGITKGTHVIPEKNQTYISQRISGFVLLAKSLKKTQT